MSGLSSKYLLQLQKKKQIPHFLPEPIKHKSPFKLQTRLSTARTTLLTRPIIKNMIQCLLPIAEQRLGSDPVFSFCFFCSFFFSLTSLPATLAARQDQQIEGSALKFDDPLYRAVSPTVLHPGQQCRDFRKAEFSSAP